MSYNKNMKYQNWKYKVKCVLGWNFMASNVYIRKNFLKINNCKHKLKKLEKVKKLKPKKYSMRIKYK